MGSVQLDTVYALRYAEKFSAPFCRPVRKMKIEYRDGALISVEVAIDLYRRSTLGERRPVDRPDIFEGMLNNSNLIISAWYGPEIASWVISRSMTDFSPRCLSHVDLAVDADYQRQASAAAPIQKNETPLGPRKCMTFSCLRQKQMTTIRG